MLYLESLNKSLHDLLSEHPEVLLIGEDLLDPYGGAFKVAKGLSTAYPEQVLSTPISEAGFTAAATGMAIRGLRPIVEIMFGDFLTLCCDQILNHATKYPWMYNGQVDVPLVIRAAVGGYRGYGPTQSQSTESMFMSVPLLSIVAPSLFHDPGELLKRAVLSERRPTLFIENKILYPQELCTNSGSFDMQAKAVPSARDDGYNTVVLSMVPDEPPDVTLITYGGVASLAKETAYELFMEEEIIVEVVVPSQIRPVPLDDMLDSVRASGRVMVVEEGHKIGGWGGEVVSQILESSFSRIKTPPVRMGAADHPIPSSLPMELAMLPSKEGIRKTLLEML